MSVPAVPDPADLAAQAPDLRAALSRFLDRHLLELNAVLDVVEAHANGAAPLGDGAAYERRQEEYRLLAAGMRDSVRALTAAMRDPVADPAERPVEKLSWRALSTTAARDEEAAQELWGAVKAAAGEELASGRRGATAVEPLHGDPLDRAWFLAMREALADGLQPRKPTACSRATGWNGCSSTAWPRRGPWPSTGSASTP